MEKLRKILTDKPYETISFVVLLYFFSPIFVFQNDVKFLIHDNMDGLVPLYTFMGQKDVFWANSDARISGIMDTLPRACLPSVFSFFRLLFLIFSPLLAYSIHYIFQHLIAFIGMRLLIKDYINQQDVVYNLVALAFACLPYWPGGELTVAGLPLLVWSFLSIINKRSNFLHWMIIVLFPFFSSLTFGNMFTFPMFFVFYLIVLIYSKTVKFSIVALLPFVFLGITTIVSEWNMFALFAEGFKSNRIENLGEAGMLNFKGILGVSVLAFLFGHYHFHSYHLPIVFVAIFVLIIAIRNKDKKASKLIFMGTLTIGLMYFLTVFLNNIVLIKNFNFSVRFWALMPILWYAFLAYLLLQIKNDFAKKALLFVQLLWVVCMLYPKDYYGSVYAENASFYNYFNQEDEDHQSFQSYYKIDAFKTIKTNYPEVYKGNVVSIGISPGVALYNQFKTFDAYLNLYPLEKWQSIKKINAKEYEKANLKYYSNNRAYLFSADNLNGKELHPEWDIEEMAHNNIKTIISSKPIFGQYTLIGSIENIYLYHVNYNQQ